MVVAVSDAPTVSVILPTLNAHPEISRALDSLQDQLYQDFEVVVVDDGSTDGTVELVQGRDDLSIRLIQRDGDPSVAAALNAGIDAARGTFIARQDADDRSPRARLDRQVRFLEMYPDVAVVGSGAHLVDPDGTTRSRRHVPERVEFTDLTGGNELIHGSIMARPAALRSVGGYDESFPHSEDLDLWLRLTDAGHPVRNIDTPLYQLTMDPDSAYASGLRTSKLWGRYAVARVQGEVSDDLRARVEGGDGISAFASTLSDCDRVDIATEVAQEHLRYGNRTAARNLVKAVLAEQRTNGLGVWVTAGLCIAPQPVIDAAVGTVRALKNRRIKKENAAAGVAATADAR